MTTLVRVWRRWGVCIGVLLSIPVGALDEAVVEDKPQSVTATTTAVDETTALTQTQKEWAKKVQDLAKNDLSRMESYLTSVFPLDCWTGMLRGPIAGCQMPSSSYRMSPCPDGISSKQLQPCTYETYDQCSVDALRSFCAQSVRQSVESARRFASRIPDIRSTIADCVSKIRQLVSDYRGQSQSEWLQQQTKSLDSIKLPSVKRAVSAHKYRLKKNITIPSAEEKGGAGIKKQISRVIDGKRQGKGSQWQLLNASTVGAFQYPIFRSVAKDQSNTDGAGTRQKTVFDSSVASVMANWKKNVVCLHAWIRELTNVESIFKALIEIQQGCNEAKAKGLDCVHWQEDEMLAALITGDVVAYYAKLANALETLAQNLLIIQPIVEQHCQDLESAVAQSLESLGSEESKPSVESMEA